MFIILSYLIILVKGEKSLSFGFFIKLPKLKNIYIILKEGIIKKEPSIFGQFLEFYVIIIYYSPGVTTGSVYASTAAIASVTIDVNTLFVLPSALLVS